MATTEHRITVEQAKPLDGRRDPWWRATCSCGKYRSGLYAYSGRAEDAGTAHVLSKTA